MEVIIIKNFINVSKNFLIISSYLIYSLLEIIPILLFNIDMKNMSSTTKILLGIFSSILYMIIIAIIYRTELKKELLEFKGNWKKLLTSNFKYYLMGLAIMMVSNIFISIMITGGPQNERIIQDELKEAPLYIIYSACIFAPFIEEILFRKTLRKIFPTDFIFVLMSGLLFGYIHTLANFQSATELLYIIPYGAVGAMFAYMYAKEDNIFVPIVYHAFHNTMLVLLSLSLNLM